MEIICPNCGADLLSQDIEILSSQVTLDYEIVGDIEIDCENCGEEVGELIKDRLNNYSRLVQQVLLSVNVFDDLRNFKNAVEEVLEADKTSRSGGERRIKALRLRFGLEDGISRTYPEVGDELGVGRTRAQNLVVYKALPGLRHFPMSSRLHKAMWGSPVTVQSLKARAEAAEEALRKRGGDSQTEAN